MIRLRRFSSVIVLAALLIAFSFADAVILLSTGDPSANTGEPTGNLAGSGWQYEGSFGWFLGTAIGPRHFITAKHIGIASNTFVYQGANYTVSQWFDDPMSDLRIFEVAETLPTYAPLYSRSDELGRDLVVIGRGTQRGNPVYLGGTLRGWDWGPTDGVQRWGENRVGAVNGNSLYVTFDQNRGPNKAQLSSGDSGGAVFINDAGVWKVAGICYGIDDAVSTTPTGAGFNAALFDTRGFYDSNYRLISGNAPIPNGFYALRMSDRLPWIQSIISPGAPAPSPTPFATPTPAPSPTPSPAPSPTPSGIAAAQMLSPTPGSTFTSSGATFTWSAGNANSYAILVGNSLGAADIYNSGKLSVHSITVNNIPTRGTTIYVRLRSLINGRWQSIDYTYKAYSYNPPPTPSPSPSPAPAPTSSPTPTATPRPRPTPLETRPPAGFSIRLS